MTAMTESVLREIRGNPETPIIRDAAAGTFFHGCMLASAAGSDLVAPATTAADLRVLGALLMCDGQSFVVDADRDRQFMIWRAKRGIGPFANSAAADEITAADIDTVCYAVDDQTVAKTSDTGNRSPAGYVTRVDSDGGVWIDFTRADELNALRVGGVL